ncbi:receptor like protein 29-like [Actinidia eriantha]|uniref:receptor like protein 29-like n=1 Tax=Actinidia eriantha TaxID=165200 RepID=UPI00258E1E82|nr:receptor like protein 29-like [Actinidia eriantha]
MCCYSFSLTLLLLLLSLPSAPCVCTNAHPPNNKTLQPNSMNPSELETLFKIMETISSDHTWRLSYPDPCQTGGLSWPGIECKPGYDNLLHVTRLDFGTPPNPNCKPAATFPSQIFDLPYLQSVFFFHCFTHTKTTLSVSSNSVINSSLHQLSLRSNPALIGPIPPQISSLESLHILALSQNRLSGMIPVEVFGLTSLVRLDLSYNFLTGTLPYQVGSLKNLVGLDLSYNALTGTIPTTIGQLGMLQKLDLSSNSLFGTIPDTIENLKSLVFIALSNNKFRGKFPKGIGNLQSLQCFIMDDNPMFISLPEELGNLQTLQELRLSNSGYSGAIPSNFSQLKNLSTLSLQNNRLTGEIPVGFGSLLYIYHLNLSRNLLGGVVPFNSSFLKRLGANLDLSGNPGLCLSHSEAHSVSVGVGVCGNNQTGSLIHPLEKSQAPPRGFSRSHLLFGALGFLVLQQMLVSI